MMDFHFALSMKKKDTAMPGYLWLVLAGLLILGGAFFILRSIVYLP